jgi:hypothetical protein
MCLESLFRDLYADHFFNILEIFNFEVEFYFVGKHAPAAGIAKGIQLNSIPLLWYCMLPILV